MTDLLHDIRATLSKGLFGMFGGASCIATSNGEAVRLWVGWILTTLIALATFYKILLDILKARRDLRSPPSKPPTP